MTDTARVFTEIILDQMRSDMKQLARLDETPLGGMTLGQLVNVQAYREKTAGQIKGATQMLAQCLTPEEYRNAIGSLAHE